jgi:type IV pilus assembly protein PilW
VTGRHPLAGARWLHGRARRQQAGFTLIELLVAVTVGMALVLAITLMLVRSEGMRRNVTSSNDVSSSGTYLSFVLDRQLRSAGSGFVQSWRGTSHNCQLAVARGGTQVLPSPAAFPAPFASLPTTQRLIPLLVYAGAAGVSDSIAVMAGASGLGESPMRVLPKSATGTSMRVPATIGLRANDLALVIQDTDTCLMQQVAAGFAGSANQALPFGGTYAATTVGSVTLTTAGDVNQAVLAPIGNVTGNRPNFNLIGVGANNTLVSYDLLQLDGIGTQPVPLADGVAEMRVLYGVDSDDDQVIDTWVRPTAPTWDATTLQNNTTASNNNLGRILAIRVGLILRNSTPERNNVSGSSVTLFADMGAGLAQTRTLSADEQKLRWRSVDFTVPLRNVMLKP